MPSAAAAAPALSAGLIFSDRIEALLDGRVAVDGAGLSIGLRPPQELFRDLLREARYDLGELSLGSHVAAIGAGRDTYAGLPVFLSRAFRHGNVYVRAASGIERPEQLAGRTVGLIDFHQTAAVWIRGLLADMYGVDRASVRWVTGGLSRPVLEDRAEVLAPDGVVIERSDRTLEALLSRGEIDALISPNAPRAFVVADGSVRRLWPEHRDEECRWFARTRVFPIMHLLVVRRALLDRRPELGRALFEAFVTAHRLAVGDLDGRDYPKLATPWLLADRQATLAALGGDPWTNGIEANRDTLETLLRYAQADRLTPGRLTVEALFHPVCREWP